MFEKEVRTLLDAALEENPSLFLIDFKVTTDKKISVVLDGDTGVTLQDCMNVSRAIEHNLDKETIDFGLDVASAGATTPLVMPRQYKKNLQRSLTVRTENEVVEGNLIQILDHGIVLQWKAREPKPIGKGKVTVTKEQEIAYTDIKEAKVNLKF
ncbi:ribosome assembly cofactor RimP [Flavobacteriaceae bacterium]|nr:ribosome assembly cofactor RimP [Flavobacteriaceae bacterium]